MSRAVGVGSYSVSPEKLRMLVHIAFGRTEQGICYSGENVEHNEQKGTRVDGRHELLYGTARQTMGCLSSGLYSIQENAPQSPQLPD